MVIGIPAGKKAIAAPAPPSLETELAFEIVVNFLACSIEILE